MGKRPIFLLLALLAAPAFARDPAPLRDAALAGDQVALDLVTGLTTEIGPRLAGNEAEARARDWAVAHLRALGFANVHIEPFPMKVWLRGAESGEIVAPVPQKLALTALGNSAATPAAGLTGEIVAFSSLAALKAAPAAAIRGRIVFVDHDMQPTQDGSSYGYFGAIRFGGPAIAAQKGASAYLLRSVGTGDHRLPHTGVTDFPAGVAAIPAAALSVPDAMLIRRMVDAGQTVRVHLLLTPRAGGTHQGGNVVAEVPGSDPASGIILIGGHLDSWDLATGAIDDGAGIALTTAAAKRILDGPKPVHTIRLVWFGAEEPGGFGGIDYAAVHGKERHVLVAESDFGADRVWSLRSTLDPAAPVSAALQAAVEPLGIAGSAIAAHGGSDVGTIAKQNGVPIVDLVQDGTRYFDIHHSADDTLDKIDPAQLRQDVAAWTAMLAVTADAEALPAAPAPIATAR